MLDHHSNDWAIHCLTQDGSGLSHEAQIRALCAAGASLIQLRSKHLSDPEFERLASACLAICRQHRVRLIINDRIHIASRIGADGVHLGKFDMPWHAARALAGDDFIIGGTVNNVADAERALASRALDYVGVGPYRETQTKQNLSPVLLANDWRDILSVLGPLPSYAIGGIRVSDVASVRALGVHGIAVCSGLFEQQAISRNFRSYSEAWNARAQTKG